jgi:hypothetical protein
MAQLDEEAVGGAIRRREAARARGMARIGRELAGQGALRDGVTARQAAHLVWLLTSFESFDLLYTGRGLSVDQVADTLVATAERTLLR